MVKVFLLIPSPQGRRVSEVLLLTPLVTRNDKFVIARNEAISFSKIENYHHERDVLIFQHNPDIQDGPSNQKYIF